MATDGFYHCAVKPVSRATGRSAVAAAAYRAGERVEDERTGLTHDYRAKGGIVESFIIAPKNAPAWATSRARLWNSVEAGTTAINGRLATELELALPHELSGKQRRSLVKKFARDISDKYNVAVDVSIHGPGKGGDHRNHHAHVMVSHREITPDGIGPIANTCVIERKVKGQIKSVKTAGAFNPADIIPTRQAWAEAVNAAYAEAGLSVRVDHRSHQDRGMMDEPTKHLGPSASAMERRGEATDRGDINRGIHARNAERVDAEAERLSVAAAIAELAAERQARADSRELRAAVRTASAARILEAMTEKRATFSRSELVAVFRKGVDDRAEAVALATELLAHPDVIGLRETADAAVTRYTTRAVLADERQILADVRTLAQMGDSGLTDRQRNAALKNHKHLDEEQRAAFDHATSNGKFAMIAGEAGTGKSTTLAAIRDAYEGAGYRVIGMSWKNDVVLDMKAEGFKDAQTVMSALGRLDRGRDHWDEKTVLMVDEAAMLANGPLSRVISKVVAAGAKVIEVGDDKQLASIERGGMFGALRAEHGAAELHTVYRVKDHAQQAAYNLMHAGKFGAALDIFDKAGAINWTQTQDEARAALVAQWADDTKTDAAKSRFVFAYSNADVAALNADLRTVRRARGELGRDHLLPTKEGPAAFAKGDRIQFTGSAYSAKDKAAGLVTGGIGEVKAISGPRMTVALDTKAGQTPREITFTVGDDAEAGQFNAIRHGYAGTIYKGQGRTLDQTYLYHSQNWRAASAYVALSRHRERVSLFVAREVTAGAEPWMMKQGGVDALDDKLKESAARSYDTWADDNPGPASKHGLADYVAYVQDKQAERGRSAFDLEQLRRQISRADETRAASQFITAEFPPTAPVAGDPRPALSSPIRFDALKIAAKAAAQRALDPLSDLMARRGKIRPLAPLRKYDVLKEMPKTAKQPAPVADDMGDLMPRTIREELERRAEVERLRDRSGPKGYDL